MFITGYEHPQARIAEGVIAAVLIIGLMLTFVTQTWTRSIGFVAQGFALLGTLVGLFTIAIGVGPRTVPDLAYHAESWRFLFGSGRHGPSPFSAS